MELNLSDKDQMHFMGMALLLLSFVGYYTAYKTFIKGHSSFYPMIYTALAVLFVYFVGLFGLISIAPIIFALGGTILLPITVLYRRKKGSDALWCVSDLYVSIFIVLGIIWGYVVTRRIGLSHPDDFSHWFRICKVINDEELYPHTSDIRYPMYLPGTATWIYFFTRFVGFDAYKEQYVNMVEAGIIDPVKVTRTALQNATSIASTLLTTESVVADIKEDTPAMPAGAGAGMGMM